MAAESIAERIGRLRREIARHDRLYFVEAAPEIDDRAYDALVAELAALEASHPELADPSSPTQRVGGQPVAGFASVPHSRPMLSLQNTYAPGEVSEFDARLRRFLGDDAAIDYVAELKIDGVAVALRYEEGRFTLGLTRGDGATGDDITANLRTVRGLPLRLASPETIEVRGEAYIPRSLFLDWNRRRAEEGERPLANPRNACAGTLKLLDSREVARRPLRLFAYAIAAPEALGLDTQHATLLRLRELGFPVEPHHLRCAGIDAVIAHCDTWRDRRFDLDYETDGMVIKVDRHDLRERLGSTSKAPRWGIAYKYETKEAITQVREITLQVGRTGAVTPVANLEPVELLGTIVRRATLHNADEIARLDVRAGDWVTLIKGGEIIPRIVGVLFERRRGDEPVFAFPATCPECGEPLVRDPEEVAIRCENEFCPARRKEQILHFVARGAMDIEGIGESLTDQLVDQGLAGDAAGLYALTEEALAGLERMGDLSAANLVRAIAGSRERPLHRFLFALGIRHVGANAARLLARAFGTLDRVREASVRELASVHGIGEATAVSLRHYFDRPETDDLLRRFAAAGVRPEAEEVPRTAPLAGKTFVLTGTLDGWTREDARGEVERRGGRVSASVSRRTDFVVAGRDAGSKLAKAETLGVAILDEAAFRRLLENSVPPAGGEPPAGGTDEAEGRSAR